MDSKIQLFSILVFVLASFHVISTESQLHKSDEIVTAKGDEKLAGLVLVGNFSRKNYFTDYALELTWEEADKYCKSYDLTLVIMDSQEEYEYMVDNLMYWVYYWIYARDSKEFVWGDGKPVNVSQMSGTRLCLQFYTGYSGVQPNDCENKNKPLCQSLNL